MFGKQIVKKKKCNGFLNYRTSQSLSDAHVHLVIAFPPEKDPVGYISANSFGPQDLQFMEYIVRPAFWGNTLVKATT